MKCGKLYINIVLRFKMRYLIEQTIYIEGNKYRRFFINEYTKKQAKKVYTLLKQLNLPEVKIYIKHLSGMTKEKFEQRYKRFLSDYQYDELKNKIFNNENN